MPKFLVRVTIHRGSEQDYQRLHEAMAGIGCGRTIVADNGLAYRLPDATYIYATAALMTASAVHEAVVPLVKRTVPRQQPPEVLVAEYSNAAWSGLPPLQR